MCESLGLGVAGWKVSQLDERVSLFQHFGPLSIHSRDHSVLAIHVVLLRADRQLVHSFEPVKVPFKVPRIAVGQVSQCRG